jgi:two-component system chemotaxis response regulator CheY
MTASLFHGRILCVEDDRAVLSALVAGLESYHFEVVSALHGGYALDKFHLYAGKFDAVLTDHDMPQVNGLALVKYLRALDFKGRVVVMSGHLTPPDYRAYQEFAIGGFFQKPFDISLLAELLLSQ